MSHRRSRHNVRVTPEVQRAIADAEIRRLVDQYMGGVGGPIERYEDALGGTLIASFRVGFRVVRFLARADGIVDMILGD